MNEMFSVILKAVAIIGGMGIVFGALLGIASKIFEVKTDERVPQILEVLPGANCGGCGFAGCSAYASALCEGGVKTNLCPVGGDAASVKISGILGIEAEASERKIAKVMCGGCEGNAILKYEFAGPQDCRAAVALGGGNKLCDYACVGLGSCVSACSFNGISIENGVAVIDGNKCYGCGSCVDECPKGVIKLVPAKSRVHVICSSKDKGKQTRLNCTVGCIGCGICAKGCPKEAIAIENNHAVIDYEKCVNCGICVSKCPQKCIVK